MRRAQPQEIERRLISLAICLAGSLDVQLYRALLKKFQRCLVQLEKCYAFCNGENTGLARTLSSPIRTRYHRKVSMDVASSIVGLIGLVGSTATTTTKLVSLVQDCKDLPKTLAGRLNVLGDYMLLLKDLEIYFARTRAYGIKIDTLNIGSDIERCERNIQALRQNLENAQKDVTGTKRVERQVKKLMTIAQSSRTEKQFKLIQDDMDVLGKWRTSLNR